MKTHRVDGFIEQDARGITAGWSAQAEQRGWSRADAISVDAYPARPIDQRSLFAVAAE